MRSSLAVLVFCLASAGGVASDDESVFREIVADFPVEFASLKIPEIQLGYEETLRAIQPLPALEQQKAFFQKFRSRLARLRRSKLAMESKYQFDLLKWETARGLERLELEQRFKRRNSKIPAGGMYRLPDGRHWYEYSVRKWTSAEVEIPSLYDFGLREVRRVRSEIGLIQKQLGFEGRDAEFCAHLKSPRFTETDETALVQKLEQTRDTVYKKIGALFADTSIPLVDIRAIRNSTKDTPPGYYDDGTFYYGFFGNRFPLRNLEWLFIHEAVPGHHYQVSVSPKASAIAKHFWYPGFSEGWAAYTENLGKELGVYTDPYQYLGKWEWDLVRSARVSIDVGINYYGWSKARALRFWKQQIPCQDEIAEREVDRIFRWPGQVLSYKVGEHEMLRSKALFQKSRGARFDSKEFHSVVLKRGTLPLYVLRQVVEDAVAR